MRSWTIKYIRQFKIQFSWSLLFGFLGVTSSAMLLFISGFLITKSSLRPENIMVVYVPIVAVRAFSISRAVFLYLQQLISHNFVLSILEKMRRRLYGSLEPQAISLQSKHQTGDLLGVLSEDIERLQDFYLRTIFPATLGLFVYGILSLVLGFFNLPFAFLTLAMLGIIVFLIPYISYKRLEHNYQTNKRLTHLLYERLTDVMFGRMDWLASGRTDEIFTEAKRVNRHLFKTEAEKDRFQRYRDLFVQLVSGIFVVAMIYWTTSMSHEDIIHPTLIAAFVLMAISLTDVLNPVSESIERVPGDLDSLKRIQHVTTDERQNHEASGEQKISFSQPKSNEILFKDVSFRYGKNSKNVLDRIHLSIPSGSKLAILGRSGSGKSTLIQLLSGLRKPNNGSITIGSELANEAMLGQTIGVLNQKPHLFQTTIRNNLRIANQDVTDEEIMEAIEKAQLKSLIDRLPQGLDTQMDEMGKRFSGGERQRIAFCRLLLQDTPVVVLDEPTIGLDFYAEERLLDTMLTALHDRTVILVTHHLISAKQFDELIFLKDGKISLQGTHDELLKTSPYYQKLIELDS